MRDVCAVMCDSTVQQVPEASSMHKPVMHHHPVHHSTMWKVCAPFLHVHPSGLLAPSTGAAPHHVATHCKAPFLHVHPLGLLAPSTDAVQLHTTLQHAVTLAQEYSMLQHSLNYMTS